MHLPRYVALSQFLRAETTICASQIEAHLKDPWHNCFWTSVRISATRWGPRQYTWRFNSRRRCWRGPGGNLRRWHKHCHVNAPPPSPGLNFGFRNALVGRRWWQDTSQSRRLAMTQKKRMPKYLNVRSLILWLSEKTLFSLIAQVGLKFRSSVSIPGYRLS